MSDPRVQQFHVEFLTVFSDQGKRDQFGCRRQLGEFAIKVELQDSDSFRMSGNRIDISQEALLWRAALDHFGESELYQIVVELWQGAGPPARPTVEYLDEDEVGPVVINLLKIAQVEVDGVVPFREDSSNRVTLYSRHAQHLVDGLLERMPANMLTRQMRTARVSNDLGV
ncbi:hypothetical protein [Pseudomonas putida]|uniref:hypothetical protein n=2 Tax=Pseudomonas TaxID=286 RepID=UPI0015E6EC4A|nr:hypothetical protein [Pseudomonas putida]